MSSKAKKIIPVLIVLIAAAMLTGYLLWNKPHTNVQSAEAVYADAPALYTAFVADSAAANSKYVDKVLEVNGTVQKVFKNQEQQTVLSLQTATEGAYINCTMEQKGVLVKEGSKVKIKGICNGLGQGDAELGILGDVYLIRCYTVE